MDANEFGTELVAVVERDGIPTVNARELHAYLEVGTRFNDWITSRIEKYGFSEGQDYTSLTGKIVSGNNATGISYYITLDMAKELAMVENNEKGREARKYFIAVEKKFKEKLLKPSTDLEILAQGVLAANRIIEEKSKALAKAEEKIAIDAPKVEHFDVCSDATGMFTFEQVAKTLNFKDMGRNNLMKFLRDKKVLQQNNHPKQAYVKLGFFKLVENFYYQGEIPYLNTQTFVTHRGLEYIRKQLVGGGYEINVIAK